MTSPAETRTGPTSTLKIGVQFGVILGILAALSSVIGFYAQTTATNTLITSGTIISLSLSFILYIATVVLYIWAGIRASALTGSGASGMMAGLMAGLVNAIIASIAALIVTFSNLPRERALAEAAAQRVTKAIGGPQQAVTNATITQGVFLTVVVTIVVGCILGLALGALGGAIGKGRAKLPTAAYEEALYTGVATPPKYDASYGMGGAQAPYSQFPPHDSPQRPHLPED